MTNLEQALSFANYQFTLSQQRKVLKQQFDDSCVFPWNGGLFKITIEFLGGLAALKDKVVWLIDMNGNPINIPDLEFFYNSAYKQYTDAIEVYGTEYAKLKTQRSVKTLVDL